MNYMNYKNKKGGTPLLPVDNCLNSAFRGIGVPAREVGIG